jgi:hypothetical protein
MQWDSSPEPVISDDDSSSESEEVEVDNDDEDDSSSESEEVEVDNDDEEEQSPEPPAAAGWGTEGFVVGDSLNFKYYGVILLAILWSNLVMSSLIQCSAEFRCME